MIAGKRNPQQTGNTNLQAELSTRLVALLKDVRDRRKPREQTQWLSNQAAWMAKSIGREQYVSDTFKHYIPIGRRATERFVVRVTQTLLPSPRFFEVFPGNEYDLQAGKTAD